MMTPVPRELPSGTVTFLFTDVEGSTGHLHKLGVHGYAEALAEHRGMRPRRAGAHLFFDRVSARHPRPPRPRRAPPEGPVCARAHLPARRRRLSAAREPASDKSAHPLHPFPGPRGRAERSAWLPL